MSVEALTKSLKIVDISPGEKFVLVVLANYSDSSGFSYPSQERLAELTCLSIRSVIRHLQTLETVGLIERKARYSDGHRVSDGYWLRLDSYMTNCQVSASHTCQSSDFIHDTVSGIYKDDTKERDTKEELKDLAHRVPGVVSIGDPLVTAFEDAWTHWPKKASKKRSLEKFRRAVAEHGTEVVTSAMKLWGAAYRDRGSSDGTGAKYVPELPTWFSKDVITLHPVEVLGLPGNGVRRDPRAPEGPVDRFAKAIEAGMRAQQQEDASRDRVYELGRGGEIASQGGFGG